MAVTWPLGADWTLRYEESFEVEGQGEATKRSEAVLRFDGARARFDSSSYGTFILDTEAGSLVHVRPDQSTVVFPLPLDFAKLVSIQESEELESIRGLFGSGDTSISRSDTHAIDGHPAELVQLQTIFDLGGRNEDKLWLAKDLDGAAAASLLGYVGQLHFGTATWMDFVGNDGHVPFRVEQTVEGRGPRRVWGLRLVGSSESRIPPEVFERPDDVEVVPFSLSEYVRIGPSR